MVGAADHREVVLDEDYGIAPACQLAEHFRQGVGVARVQAHRGLVQDVEGFGEPVRELAR